MKKLNLKLLLVLFLFSSVMTSVLAMPAYQKMIEFTQPDGSVINIFLKGDENVKWAETEDGFSLMFNKDGYYEYAKLDTRGDMVPSGIRANDLQKRTNVEKTFLANIQKNLRYNRDQVHMMKQITNIYNTQKRAFPTTGTRKLVCILMGFTDKAFTKTQADINNLYNQVGYTTGGATGSVHDFFAEASYNQFDLTVTVAGPYTASNTMAYYGGNDASGNDLRPDVLASEAVTLANPDVNYADFDNDADGNVDGVYIIYAGFGEEAGAAANAIWAHAWSFTAKTLDGKSVSTYSCSAELRGSSGTNMTRIGVICHEFGHVLGAPDFYDTDYATGGEYDGTGEWDLQAGGSWNGSAGDGATPAHPNMYTKCYIYGWVTPTVISTAQALTLQNSTTNSSTVYRYNTATANEFFLLENRQQTGFNTYCPGHGLLVYHADGTYIAAHDNANDIDATSHQGLYLEAGTSTIANGIQVTPSKTNTTGCPFPGSGAKTTFDDTTTPNSKSWAGVNTAKPLLNITETAGVITLNFMSATPTLTVTPTTLTGFTYILGNGPSANQTYTLSGANLTGTGNITVTGSTNYEVSTDGTTFAASVTYPFASGIVTGQPKTVYVRLKSGLAVASYNSEIISNAGGSATTLNVTCSGTVTAAPAVTLADNGTQVSAANVAQGTSTHVLHKFSLAVASANTSLTGIQATTAGTYVAADITNLKIRYSADATLDAGDATLSTYTNPGAAGAKTFPSFTAQTINSATTGYVFITADVASGAVIGNTINISAVTTAQLTFAAGTTKSGSTTAGGIQTVIAGATTSTCISESFETFVPASWTNSGFATGTAFRTGAKSADANATGDAIISPLISNPLSLSFWYKRSGTAPTTPKWSVYYSASTSGPWTQIGSSITTFTTTYTEFTASLSGLSNIYIKIADERASGTNLIYLDDFTVICGSAATPTVALANNGTQVAAANINQGTTANVLHKFSLAVTTANATLSGLTCTTAGTYATADITNLKVKYSVDATLDAGDATLSTLTSPGTAGLLAFNTFTSQVITAGSTGYIFITADVSATATHNNTISVNAISFSNITIGSINSSGSTTAGGTQTIKDVTAPTVTTYSPTDGNTAVTVNQNLVLTFNENVAIGTAGNIVIYNSNATVFETILYSDAKITFSTNTVTINPAGTFAIGANYYVQIAATAIKDANGNAYAGISDATTWNFSIVGPTVTNVTSTTTDGTYKVGDAITITVTFDAVVNVTGSPQIQLETGTTDQIIYYTSGTGTNTLTFTYTVAAGQTTPDLDFKATTSFTLNGGTINSAGGVAATLTLPTVGGASSIAGQKAIVIDGVLPTVTTYSPADETLTVTANQNLVLTFSENVQVGTAGNIVIYNSDNSVFETILYSDAKITFSTNTVTINPAGTFASGASYYVQIANTVIRDANGNAYAGISNATTWNFTVIKIEPTNQVTAFTCGTTTSSSIPLTWTGAVAGSQAPDGYLILWSTGTITAPVDGTAQADAAGIKNITYGTNLYTVTGLTSNTTYNFQIWSYTNSGTNINYNLTSAPTTSCATTVATGPILAWQFGSPASLGSEATYTATTIDANLNTSSLSRGAGISAIALARSFASNSWDIGATKAGAVTNNEYYQFTVNSKVGYLVNLSTLDVRLRRTSTAPNAYIWKYSTNGSTFTEIGTDISFTSTADGVDQTQIDLSGIAALQNVATGTTITFRLYAWGGITDLGGTFSIARFAAANTSNCLAIGGTVVAAGPVLTLNPTTLTGFTYTLGSGPSANQTYTLSGLNLSGTGNITVTGSTNYEVSTDGTTYLSSVTYPFASGIVTGQPKTVYVRLISGLSVASYNGETISNAGGGATTVNVTCSGSVTNPVPAVVLANNGTQVATTNVAIGTSAHVLHKFQLGVTVANAALTGMTCTTAGTYASADVTNLKVRYSADATLDAGDATLSTLTTPGVGGAKTFPTFTSQTINSGTTGYIFITADISGSATNGNTISVNAIATTNLTFTSASKSGSTTVGGTQTISCTPISSFPWNENFDAVTIPAFPSCWLKEGAGDWVTTNNADNTYDADARSGTQFLKETYTATNEYIWTPGFTLTAGTSYNFSFWWAGDNFTGWTGDVFYNTSQVSTGATQMGSSFVATGTTTTKTYAERANIFTAPTSGTYYFAIRVNANATPWYLSFDDFKLDVNTIKPEPTNQPTVFACGTTTTTSIPLTWTGAATGTQAPDGYLILWSTGAITAPVDGVAQADASGIKNITYGTNAYSATGLTSGTTYNFQIWSYTNSGTDINYNLVSAPTTSCATTAVVSPLAAWDFFGQSSPVTFAATTFNANLNSSSNIIRGAGAVSSSGANSFRTTGFGNDGISTSNTDYFEITLAPTPGFQMSLSTIDAKFIGTDTYVASPGVTSQFAYSLDGTTFTLIGSPVQSTSLSMTQIDISGVSALQNVQTGTTVYIRYYASGQTGTGGWGFSSTASGNNGLAIGGTIIPAGPTISVGSITSFGNVCTSSTSLEKTITVIGTGLSNDITITAPSNFEISTTSGSGFTNSITLTQTAGSVSATNIYVHFIPSALTSYSSNITLVSSGATSKNVAVSGTGVNNLPPTITSPTSASVTATTAILGGNITVTGCTNVTERGIYWSTTNGFADGAGTKVSVTAGPYSAGVFTINVSGLSATTTYYYKAFATNSLGTVYTVQGTFTTPCATYSLPFNEGFNATTIPTCWNSVVTNDPGVDPALSYVASASSPTISAPTEGSHFVSFNSYDSPVNAEMRLISPPITTTGSTGINISFDWFESTGFNTSFDGVTLQYSTNGGASWSNVQVYTRYNAIEGWKTNTIVLPAGADNQASLTLGFLFHSAYGNNCGFDNLRVYTCSEPTTNPITLTFSNITNSTLDLTIGTLGNGVNRLIVAREASAVNFTPVDNTTYAGTPVFSDGTDLGSGNIAVYSGSASTVSISGLKGGTQYYFKVFEYNCTIGYENYYTGGTLLSGNTTTLISPVTNLEVSCQTNTSATISWVAPTGSYDGVIIGIRNSTLDAHVVSGDANNFIANSVFPGTVPVPPSTSAYGGTSPYSWIAYKGVGTSATITGLTAGQPYKIKAYAYKNNTGSTWATTQPTATISALGTVNVTNVSAIPNNAQVQLQWINPSAACFDEVMIVVNAGAAITTAPSGDGSTYNYNLNYGSGDAYGSGFIVYKGVFSPQLISGLTNGTEYCFTIFTRNGTSWSSGATVCSTPLVGVTIMLPGDLAIIAVNTAAKSSGSDDEICFFAFKDITVGTAIDFTDNGYERLYDQEWASSEGTMRLHRTSGGTIPAGNVVCFQGAGHTSANFKIFNCGTADDANWTITSLNGIGDYDLNVDDQIWIIQGGTWNNFGSTSNHNATYSGNVLYGWTATGWKPSTGYNSTKGSTLFPETECFNTDVTVNAGHEKVKYIGDMTTTSQYEWITRINDDANWLGFTDNAGYNASTRNYVSTCFQFVSNANITIGSAGVWTGAANEDWFSCANWQNLRLPRGSVNVSISGAVSNHITIDDGIPTLLEAECNNLTIASNATVGGADIKLKINNVNSVLKLYGDLVNNKTIEHTDGVVMFIGSDLQNITGTVNFFKLEINNTSTGVNLNNDISVSKSLTLTDGNITTGIFKLNLTNSLVGASDGILTYSNASFINGNLRRTIRTNTNSYTFPVGNINSTAGYHRVDMINNNLAGTSYIDASVATLVNTGNNLDSKLPSLVEGTVTLTDVLESAEWTLTPDAQPSSGTYNVRLYVENISGLSAADNNMFFPVKRDDVSATFADWSKAGGTGVAKTYASGFGERTGYTSFSKHGLIKGGVVTPVQLLFFDAVRDGIHVNVDWSTASEINNDFFTVERSRDANNFDFVLNYPGAGNSLVPLNYNITDYMPYSGKSYYRLKQTDFDGKFTYSNIVAVEGEKAKSDSENVEIVKVQNAIQISIENNSTSDYFVQVTDMLGRILFTEKYNSASNKVMIDIDSKNYKTGIYNVSVVSSNSIKTNKIFVE